MSEVEKILPLSPLQEGMLFHSVLSPETGVYVEQRWCVIEGDLDEEAFRKAWDEVVNRHEALRAEFHWEETEEPVQVIYEEVSPEWKLERPDDFEAFLKADRKKGFTLDEGPLIRFALFPLEKGRYQFVWTFHHLLMDGWGNGVLIREVFTYYEAAKKGRSLTLPAAVPYERYLSWLGARNESETEEFWGEELAGF